MKRGGIIVNPGQESAPQERALDAITFNLEDAEYLRALASSGGIRGKVAEMPQDRCSLTGETRDRLEQIADAIDDAEEGRKHEDALNRQRIRELEARLELAENSEAEAGW